MKKGFTLVELSIVLVIIGLLVGGILVGQSLIESAQISRFVRDIQQYDAAGIIFKQKFKSLAGDTNKFSPKGNNDGLISTIYTVVDTPDCGLAPCVERYSYWKHLSDSGILQQKYTNDWSGTTAIKPGINSPKAAFGNSYLLAGPRAVVIVDQAPYGNYYTAYANAGQTAPNGSQGISVDTKLDDGNAITGAVRAYIPTVGPCTPVAVSCQINITMYQTNSHPLNF